MSSYKSHILMGSVSRCFESEYIHVFIKYSLGYPILYEVLLISMKLAVAM